MLKIDYENNSCLFFGATDSAASALIAVLIFALAEC